MAGCPPCPGRLPRGHAAPINTLAALYGAHPSVKQVLQGIRNLPDAKLANLLRWAVMQQVPLNAAILTPLFAAPAPHAQETALLALYYHRTDAQAVRLAVAQTYAHPAQAAPMALTLANLLNVEMNLKLRDALPALLQHEDLGFSSPPRKRSRISAARGISRR